MYSSGSITNAILMTMCSPVNYPQYFSIETQNVIKMNPSL
jgi:hypothetical protein